MTFQIHPARCRPAGASSRATRAVPESETPSATDRRGGPDTLAQSLTQQQAWAQETVIRPDLSTNPRFAVAPRTADNIMLVVALTALFLTIAAKTLNWL